MFTIKYLFIRYLCSLPNITLTIDYVEGWGEVEGILPGTYSAFYYTFDLIDFSQLDSFNLGLSSGTFDSLKGV